jgi:hypothetical protein
MWKTRNKHVCGGCVAFLQPHREKGVIYTQVTVNSYKCMGKKGWGGSDKGSRTGGTD